jgi:hypothetical protein
MSDLPPSISTETALRLLTKRQRRRILRRVADTPEGTTVDGLTEHLAVAGSTTSNGNGLSESRGIELHHVHLPMLREADVIEYDAGRPTVRRGREFQRVLSLLEAIDGHRKDTPTDCS